MGRLERDYQPKVIARIREMFPGCVVMKNDSGHTQGIPDWTILYENKWATLEIKKDEKSKLQPNQSYYVQKMQDMSFSAILHPGNEEEVLNALREAFSH